MISLPETLQQKTLVKVCGLTHQSDVDTCIGMGVHFCGFIFHPNSPRYISPFRVNSLRSAQLRRVGVFVKQEADEILQIMKEARLDFAQLHGNQSVECARQIGAHRVIRVLWPQRYESMEQMLADMEHFADSCCLFLLDAGTTGGGSGKTIDWKQLHGMDAPRPWLLAGGLSGTSLPQALADCTPNGVDLNSGVEWAPGHKSPTSLLSALHAITQQNTSLYA